MGITAPGRKYKRKCLNKEQWEYIHSQEKVCVVCKKKGLIAKIERHRFLEIDHIIPIAEGGTNDKDNLQWLCRIHNRHKESKNSPYITEHETYYFIMI